MSTFFLDFENGSDAADGTSFANRWRTVTTGATTARIAPADTIRIMQSPSPTSLGQNATFTNKSTTVTLTSAVTANISLCEAGWTASANVTASTTTTRKQGSNAATFAVAGAFTTGLAAYEAMGSTDFSSYEQISFWIHTDTAVAANSLSLKLCSDAAGATPVDTFTINFALTANRWCPITINKGSTLGAAIQSVALYVDTDLGGSTVNLRLDNILAVKAVGSADSLNLCSLIGKSGTNELWYPIRSINGTTVTLDESANTTTTTTPRGYSGTTATVTAYKRETIKFAPSTGSHNAIQDSGTSGSPITFSGGWDTTNMSTQPSDTWIDGRTSQGTGWDLNSKAFIVTEKISIVRCSDDFSNNGADNTFSSCNAVAGGNDGFTQTSAGVRATYTSCTSNSCTGNGILISSATYPLYTGDCIFSSNAVLGVSMASTSTNNFVVTGTISANNNASSGISISVPTGTAASLVASDNGASGLLLNDASVNLHVNLVSCVGNTNRALNITNADSVHIYDYRTATSGANESIAVNATIPFKLYIKDAMIGESTRNGALTAGKNQRIQYQALGGTSTSHLTVTDVGTIQSDTGADRHTLSGIAWKLSPTSTVATQYYPLTLPIAKIAVSANNLLTVTAWCKRDSTSITGRLRLAGGRVAGIDSDVTDTITLGAGTYEQLELQATPTEDGVVEIYYDAYGGTTLNTWIDDLDFNQA